MLRRRADFRRLFLAHAVSRAGDAFNTVALVILVFDLTGSGIGVAATVAFEVLPVLLLGPALGLLVDRRPRRRLMVAADLGRAALAALLAAAHGSVVLAYVVAFGLASWSQLFNPAASSLVPDVVEADELVDANTALWTVAVAAQVVLAPVAGLVIAAAGVGPAFALNAVSFVVSALLLRGLGAGRAPASDAVRLRTWAAIAGGLRAVRTHPLLARMAAVQILAAASAGATGALLVVLASEWLGLGPSGFGLLLAAIGVGAVAGPLGLRRFIRPADRFWLFAPYGLRGLVDLCLAAVASPFVAAPALAAYGLGTSSGMVAFQSTLQHEVPPDLRGRVFSLFDVLWQGARLLSLGAGGLLADAVGVRAVYLAGGLLLLAAFAVGWLGTPVMSSREDGSAGAP
ncbi:MAG: MFS transporter [Actinomycetota bacterium]|nr:MFS transporter [Actinomycetota bacterium]